MPPPGTKQQPIESKPLVVSWDLKKFANNLMSFIADESPKGLERIIAVIQRASDNYKKPIDNWFTGWLYTFTRARLPEIERAKKSIEAFPDAYTRLQEFESLVGSGQWNQGSFNYLLFVELIREIPGYEPVSDEKMISVIPDLREIIRIDIATFKNEYLEVQKSNEIKHQELTTTQTRLQKSVNNLLISNDLTTAESIADNQIERSVLCLTYKNNLWHLTWIDPMKKRHSLEPSEEIIKILKDQHVYDIAAVSALSTNKLKHACLRVKEAFLEKVKLLINPQNLQTQMSSEQLLAQGIHSTFILIGQPKAYRLWYVNTLNKPQEICLADYPVLQQWLNQQNDPKTPDEDYISQLKSLLFQIRVTQSLDAEAQKFKTTLSDCLGHRFGVKRELRETKRLDMSAYSEVQQCLENRVAHKNTNKKNTAAVAEQRPEQEPVKRLTIEDYAVAGLFGHKLNAKRQRETVLEVETPVC